MKRFTLLSFVMGVLLASTVYGGEYYTHGNFPSPSSPATSAGMRAEFDLIQAGFDKLPQLTGNAGKIIVVNPGGTGLSTLAGGTISLGGNFTTTGAFTTTLLQGANVSLTLPTASGTLATLAGTETFTAKTYTNPIFSGTATGSLTNLALTTPTLTTPTFSGTVSGTYTLTGATLSSAVVTADPVTALGVASKQYVDNASGAISAFTTGDVKLTIKTVADAGWVLMNDGTIGSASSGASSRANADTQSLYYLIWANCANSQCPVSSGRGASAAADFSANKTLALPKALGRALATYGTGAGLSARLLGEALGVQDAVVVAHSHSITDPGHTHTYTSPDSLVANSAGGGQPMVQSISPGSNTSSSTTGVAVNSTGVSGTGANMQPTIFLNVMIKL